MKAIGTNPETGETQTLEVSQISASYLEDFKSLTFSKKELRQQIENLSISADAKVLLEKMATGVIKVGSAVIKVGQKIIELVLKIMAKFPNASFGLIFGAMAGVLIASVPIIGLVLGPIVTPLLAALGLILGTKADFENAALEGKIREAIATFDPLVGERPA